MENIDIKFEETKILEIGIADKTNLHQSIFADMDFGIDSIMHELEGVRYLVKAR